LPLSARANGGSNAVIPGPERSEGAASPRPGMTAVVGRGPRNDGTFSSARAENTLSTRPDPAGMDPMSIIRRGATGLSLVRLRGISWPGARRGPAASDPVGTARPHASAASEFAIIAALCLWTLILRLPFFFPDTIDWDESTLIIMGQGILDGYLPYDRIWDSKPPLAFVAFAGAIELLGRSVAAIRFVGYLCVVSFTERPG
jgi:hypothetical protein